MSDSNIRENGKGELADNELYIALACAVGTNIKVVIDQISKHLNELGYLSEYIKVSKELIEPAIKDSLNKPISAFDRANKLMDQGNNLRKEAKCNWILAAGIASYINAKHTNREPVPKTAYIIDSLKHPEEAEKLREIYPAGFYLFAINESEDSRCKYLIDNKNIGRNDARMLIQRDMNESASYGQHTRDVFELADFHLSANVNEKNSKDKTPSLELQINRILDLIFGHPFTTPTFDEYAMFMAYSSGLRSADLSRQVGAVITKENDIIATGANDVPTFGGGQYWPDMDYNDAERGRDHKRGYDSNKIELYKIIDEIVELFDFEENDKKEDEVKKKAREALLRSSLKNLTEFGRPVHAEMAAIMSCAKNGISLKGATLYCSTFPCHNCAKHIISAGITKVVYIEPYPKSRTLDLYDDSISISGEEGKVNFQEFVGIGPRRFYDLFSMRLSTGRRIRRKDQDGNCVEWNCKNARVRCQMFSTSYIDKETVEALKWERFKQNLENKESN